MFLEIINPSDKVTIEADDVTVAGVAVLLVGRGSYALRNQDGKTVFPLMLFGGIDDWMKENKIDDLNKYLVDNADKIADVLESVVYGGFEDRNTFNDAIDKMSKVDAAKFRAEWNDKRCSSLNNIGKTCLEFAKKLREADKKNV